MRCRLHLLLILPTRPPAIDRSSCPDSSATGVSSLVVSSFLQTRSLSFLPYHPQKRVEAPRAKHREEEQEQVMKKKKPTILTPTRINLSIGTITRTKHRSMMTFINLFFFARIKIIDPDPGIFGRTSYESIPKEWVERG
jgi:hypothetical protein